MSHFSFLYQGIHKQLRQQLAVLFILIITQILFDSNGRPFFFFDFIDLSTHWVVLLATMSSFCVTFSDVLGAT
jgi:hypothetical protein